MRDAPKEPEKVYSRKQIADAIEVVCNKCCVDVEDFMMYLEKELET